jgi:NtrC-family two-component system sensor histidine kinase KinB
VTLRGKILLAQAPLVFGLIALGVVGSTTISRLGRSSQRILSENYRSVLAVQRMSEAIDELDTAAAFLVAGRRDLVLADSESGRKRFEVELAVQEGNITEAGERDATARLRARWMEYQATFDHFLQLSDPGAVRTAYFDEVHPSMRRVKAAAGEILAMNEDAMVRKSEVAQHAARQLDAVIIAASFALLLAGFLASVALTTRLLRPLSVLGQAVRRLGQGDPQARARIGGSDEVSALAGEFNTMADRLEQYRKSSLGELLQAQQAAQAAIDSLPDPVAILTGAGEVLTVNEAAEKVLRISVDKRWDAAEPPVAAALEKIRAHVAGGRGPYVPRGFDEAIRVVGPDGERHFLPRATPLYGEAGDIAGVTLVFEDVTRLLRIDQLKSDMVATVAHEFRTPLTSLRMAIHLLAEGVVGPLTEKQADLLFGARDDAERLLGIVDELLDLSRIQAGRLELNRRSLPLDPLVRSTVDAHRAQAAERKLQVEVEIPPDTGELSVDADRLILVFDNLLANAIRFSPEGGRVVVRVRPGADAVRFEVSDAGPGVPRELREAIFQKLFRAPGAPPGGAGLGLFIAREIVVAHGGTIGVESDVGKGSTFWFELPRALT